jgi:hypothetical protein
MLSPPNETTTKNITLARSELLSELGYAIFLRRFDIGHAPVAANVAARPHVEPVPPRQRGVDSGLAIQLISGIAGRIQPSPATT